MATHFQFNWLQDPKFKDWLQQVPSDNTKAHCKICNFTMFLSNMGRSALTSPSKRKEHQRRMKAGLQSPQLQCFSVLGVSSKSPTVGDSSESFPTFIEHSLCSNSSKTSVPSISCLSNKNIDNTLISEKVSVPENITQLTVPKPRGLKSLLLNEGVLKAEILWCMHSVVTHKSMRMSEKYVSLFQTLFPDSEIAQKMKLRKSKIAYSVLYGISPYFQNELLDKLSKCKYITVGFDESLNKISQKTQMDVNVRFWCSDQNLVCARYLTSTFLGSSTSDKIRESFKTALSSLNLKAIVQISMDGPNVNLKFYRDLKIELECKEDYPILLNIGTCGLHILHGAFKKGIQVTNWSLIRLFRSLYNLFKDVPARRALYSEYTDSDLYPKKFCSIRWLQNSDVCQRAIDMLPHIRKFVHCVRKDKKEPACASFKIVENSVDDDLLEAKLAFFKSVSKEVEPFLKEYQTDVPMAPFLYNSLTSIVRNIMSRFVKESVLIDGCIHKIDLSNNKNLKSASEIDLGYGTRSALRKRNKQKVSDNDILQFRKESAACLKVLCLKLLERFPLIYPLAKALTCFDPDISRNETLNKKRIKNLLTMLVDSRIISDNEADNAEREYLKVCCDIDTKEKLKAYKRQDSGIDIFWRDIFNKFGDCDTINMVMKIVMVLSHGNANVERGFSINSECLIDNLKEETLIAQRVVYDKMKSSIEDINNYEIPKKLVQSYKNTHSALTDAVKRKRKDLSEKDAAEAKKKRLKLATTEINSKIESIKLNANKEIQILMEEIKAIKE